MRFVLSFLAVAAFCAASVPALAHPAAAAYGVAVDPPADLYLIRSPQPVPDLAGVTIHARRGDVTLVSAAPEIIAALRDRGTLVVPLAPVRGPRGASPRISPPTTRSPIVQGLADAVAWPGLLAKIDWLQGFGTRYSFAPTIEVVADSLEARFQDLGLTTETQGFQVSGHTMHNVIATQLGVEQPDSILVICAHYDCISEQPYDLAPGADDNASGTAAVLTAAELLAGIPCRYTIKYVCFAGEEQGLRGSDAWVRWADRVGLGIVGALNFDMIGWWTPGVDFDVEIESNQASVWLADIVTAAAELYTDMPFELHVYDGAWWGDHASFWEYGYAALNHEEAWDWGDPDFNPHYHSSLDVVADLSPEYTTGITRIAIASLAHLAQPVAGVAVPASPPASISLRAAPNPFNGRVTVDVAADPSREQVVVGAFDLRGRRVGTLEVRLTEGRGAATWDALDSGGRPLPAGAYMLRCLGESTGAAVRILYAK